MSLAILCVAAFGLVAYAVSGLIALAIAGSRERIANLAPAGQARLFVVAALAPALAATAVLVAALAPTFGWIADHCTAGPELHGHPHICVDHHAPVWPAVTLSILAALVVGRFAVAAARRVHALVLSRRTRRQLDRISTAGPFGARVLPVADAQAFVLGLVRPGLYITRGLLDAEPAHLEAVLAHERAHLRRLDPLRRFAAGIGLSFHLPWIARWLDRALGRSQEMAADEVAAETVGRAGVARALVALARARVAAPRAALAFTGTDVERRVLQLMDHRARDDKPKASTLAIAATLAAIAVALSADAVHHGVETLLGVFGS